MRISASNGSWIAAWAPLSALACAALIILPSSSFGGFSAHMAIHIAAMNVLAPLRAIAISAIGPRRLKTGIFWFIAILQISLLWVWHLPALQLLAGHGAGGFVLMHGSLFGIALMFWAALLRLRRTQRWHGVLGLLVTGKLSCLLAALLVFAPNSLYTSGHHGAPSLSDQQLAGLLMLTACPLSYVVAGLVLTVQLIKDLSDPVERHVRTIKA